MSVHLKNRRFIIGLCVNLQKQSKLSGVNIMMEITDAITVVGNLSYSTIELDSIELTVMRQIGSVIKESRGVA